MGEFAIVPKALLITVLDESEENSHDAQHEASHSDEKDKVYEMQRSRIEQLRMIALSSTAPIAKSGLQNPD